MNSSSSSSSTPPSVFELIRRYELHPKRSLAQNFLVDESYLARIAQAADLTRADRVLEIGPGLGVLTAHLAAQAGRVVAVELDDRLIDVLNERFAHADHVTIYHNDILTVSPAELFAAHQSTASGESAAHSVPPDRATDYKVVANLPYYITNAILRHLLEAEQPPTLAVLLVQKEVAQRICAAPGDMSLLAVSVQFYARPHIVQTVPAGAFYPRPKVDSAILRLDVAPNPDVVDVADAQTFFRIVKAGFSQKRKQLRNSLSGGLAIPKEQATALLEEAEVAPQRRAETLSLAEWARLYHTYTRTDFFTDSFTDTL